MSDTFFKIVEVENSNSRKNETSNEVKKRSSSIQKILILNVVFLFLNFI